MTRVIWPVIFKTVDSRRSGPKGANKSIVDHSQVVNPDRKSVLIKAMVRRS